MDLPTGDIAHHGRTEQIDVLELRLRQSISVLTGKDSKFAGFSLEIDMAVGGWAASTIYGSPVVGRESAGVCEGTKVCAWLWGVCVCGGVRGW